MTKKAKIEKILQEANRKFVALILPQSEIESKLINKINQTVTISEPQRYNISKEFLKLKLYRFATISLVVAVILLLVGKGIVFAAESTIPGDLLYPLNRQLEDLQLGLTKNPEKQSQLKLKFLEKRAREWQKIQQLKNKSAAFLDREKVSTNELRESFKQSLKALEEQRKNYEQFNQMYGAKRQKLEKNVERLEKISNLIRAEIPSKE